MNATERWLEKDRNLYLLAGGVFFVIGIGHLFSPYTDVLTMPSSIVSFVIFLMFGVFAISESNQEKK